MKLKTWVNPRLMPVDLWQNGRRIMFTAAYKQTGSYVEHEAVHQAKYFILYKVLFIDPIS